MIEAVNSVLSSAPLLRQAAEQQSSARENISAAPETVQAVAKAPYISPFVSVDVNFDTAVILLRDSETGDTVQQIPSEGRLESLRRQEAARQLEEIKTKETQVNPQTQQITFTETNVESSSVSAGSGSTPISQAALSAFASGAQTGNTEGTSSFATDA